MSKQAKYPDFHRLATGLVSGNVDLDKGESKEVSDFGKNPITRDTLGASNVVTSEIKGSLLDDPKHRVVLDIDMDAALIPSSTPGHFHLLIDKTLSWDDYHYLLKALADVGILQKGYYEASKVRKASVIRTPWTLKGDAA